MLQLLTSCTQLLGPCQNSRVSIPGLLNKPKAQGQRPKPNRSRPPALCMSCRWFQHQTVHATSPGKLRPAGQQPGTGPEPRPACPRPVPAAPGMRAAPMPPASAGTLPGLLPHAGPGLPVWPPCTNQQGLWCSRVRIRGAAGPSVAHSFRFTLVACTQMRAWVSLDHCVASRVCVTTCSSAEHQNDEPCRRLVIHQWLFCKGVSLWQSSTQP